MWQSIPRTGSLLLRASRPHSVQRFTRCLLSSLHASLPASSGFLLPPLSSLHASLPASSGFPLPPLSSLHASLPASSGYPLPPLLPPCLAPCVQRFPAASSPPSMPRPLRPAVYPLSLSPPSMPRSLRPAVYPLSLSPPDPVSPPLKHNKIS